MIGAGWREQCLVQSLHNTNEVGIRPGWDRYSLRRLNGAIGVDCMVWLGRKGCVCPINITLDQ